ncbi:hypothetical protein RZS08_55085, partial [Arthrospira platensis SPKY1]|nr:hypothetical protein [Arthrospira platensis SPKY1]
MWVALIGLLANIPANYVLIYGKFGFPELGAEGCGWASSFVGLMLFVSMFTYCKTHDAFARFQLFNLSQLRWRPSIQKEIFKIGVPIGVTSTMEVTAFAAVALIMARL